MKVNVGSWDRFVRILTGIGLLSITVIGPEIPWGLIGLLPLLSGVVGWCPPYTLLGISTCEKINPDSSCSNCK